MEARLRVLEVAWPERVGASDFRVVGASSSLIRHLVGRDYQVWALRCRQARDGKQCHEWRLRVRLGPDASGELAQRAFYLDAAPPGIRKARFREATEVIRCMGEATDAQLGF